MTHGPHHHRAADHSHRGRHVLGRFGGRARVLRRAGGRERRRRRQPVGAAHRPGRIRTDREHASILTILAGLALFVLRGYSLASGSGFTFGLGGLAGIVSLALGGIAGPTAARLRRLGAEIQSGGKPPTAEQAQQLQAYQARLTQSGRVAAVLAFVAAILMSFARYV
jgi:hypothetical protein